MSYLEGMLSLVIVQLNCQTKENIIHEMACGYAARGPINHFCENTAPSISSPADLGSGFSWSKI